MKAFTSPLHSERVASRLGLALAVTFTTCFLTGLYSHFAQHPSFGFQLPARPAGLYRVTQSVHVASGLTSIPLLFAKLWSVYPQLLQWPPVRNVAHAIERIAIFPLVAGSVFMVFTGFANINLWYPWDFNFPVTHYRVAWITMGALVVHIGAKYSVTRAALRRPTQAIPAVAARDRRDFLITAFGTSAIVTAFTVGETLRPLTPLALLAPRRPNVGVQGFPVNVTARDAGVIAAAQSPDYRLEVVGKVARSLSLSLDDLHTLEQHTATLPIQCVEGWSVSRRWTGVRVRDLLAIAGARPNARVRVESIQAGSTYATSDLDHAQAHDHDTLLALAVNGEPLALDHGHPCRLIGPDRPGVMQTKWVRRLVVR
jgi:DMSO/TMAO reductase YedYZ molybdopterin-dependent catalytic subunit